MLRSMQEQVCRLSADGSPLIATGRSTDLAEEVRAAHRRSLKSTGNFDIHQELEKVLNGVGLSAEDAGGKIEFTGQDPIVKSVFRLASAAAIGLVAKAVGMAKLWRMRGGSGQDISLNLGQALHRLSPFYDRKWEKLNGFAPGTPSDPTNPFMPNRFYDTKDDRKVMILNLYPRLKTSMLRFLDCSDDPDKIALAVKNWNARDLEDACELHGLQCTMVRSVDEFMREEQYKQIVSQLPLIELEKIGDSRPEPIPQGGRSPLDGYRALGLGHVIAGPATGRALALHGADVLNIWRPSDFEMDLVYCTSNVGMRSSTLDLLAESGQSQMKRLLSTADIFFANRRGGYLQKLGLSPANVANTRPGIIHVNISLYGESGPWVNRIGFDQNAGCATGIYASEGSLTSPALSSVFVVNDYLMGWLATVGIQAALLRRATEGGSYRVHVCLSRVSMWMHTLGIFDQNWAATTAGSSGDHLYTDPETFEAHTPCGIYQGVTEQVRMSKTTGSYETVLVPRGSSQPAWKSRPSIASR